MKPVRLAIAAALLAALGGALWWSNKDEKAKEGQPAKDAPPRILAIPADTVKEIDIQHRGEGAIHIVLAEKGKWQITQPMPYPADPVALTAITSQTAKLDSERLVDANNNEWASYGLEPALISVAITNKEGKKFTLMVGEPTPTGNAVYARLGGDPRLFTMPSFSKSAFDKQLKDLRDRRVFDIAPEHLSKFEVSDGKLTYSFRKLDENTWRIDKPSVMRADYLQVEELINKLKALNIDLDAPAKDADAQFAAGTLVTSVNLVDEGGAKSIQVRKNKDNYFAKSSLVPGTVRLTKAGADGMMKPLGDFRNKKLFDFGFNDPTRIEFTDMGKQSVFDKSGEKWTSGGKTPRTFDGTSVQAFVDKLRDLSAAKFVETAPAAPPVVTVNITSNAGKRIEKLEIVPSGTNFVGRHDGDTSLYEIDANMVKDLRQAASDVREEQAAKKK